MKDNIQRNCDYLVNLIWPIKRTISELSSREFLSKKIWIDLYAYTEYFNLLKIDNYRLLINEYEIKGNFSYLVDESIQRTQKSFKEFINKFGGYNGIFALALLYTNFVDEELSLVRENMLSWYFDDARIDLNRLKGGSVNAWFPFDEFLTLFSQISSSMVAAGLYDASKYTIKYLINEFSGGNRIPRCISQCCDNEAEDEEIISQLGKTYSEKLYVFGLSAEKLDTLQRACITTLQNMLDEMHIGDIRMLDDLLNHKSVPKESLGNLIEKRLVKIIEFSQDEIKPVVFPIELGDFA